MSSEGAAASSTLAHPREFLENMGPHLETTSFPSQVGMGEALLGEPMSEPSKREAGRSHFLSLLSWNVHFFLPLVWDSHHWLPWFFGVKPQHLLSRVSNLLIADRGLLSLHNQMSEFLVINLSVSLPISNLLLVLLL